MKKEKEEYEKLIKELREGMKDRELKNKFTKLLILLGLED